MKSFAERFSRAIAEAEPEMFTANIRKVQRKGRIFLDWLRNQRGATAVMPYSARAREGAPVAAPVAWEELDELRGRQPFHHPRRRRAARSRGLEGACGLGQGEASVAGCVRLPRRLAPLLFFLTAASPPELARWRAEAARVTITRDDWGIAHVHGKTDADAVFGMIYAQAEDDFPRIETNYLTALGPHRRSRRREGDLAGSARTALRHRAELKARLRARARRGCSTLMDAWADGLNYYLATHPDVQPRVITRFEPWMALSFTEGSIGGDIERVDLDQLEAFYRQAGRDAASRVAHGVDTSRRARTASPSRPTLTADGNALLLINPHTTFFFRSEAADDERRRAERLRRGDLGPVLHLPGLQRRTSAGCTRRAASTTSTSSPRRSSERGNGYCYRYGDELRPLGVAADHDPLSRPPTAARPTQLHDLLHAPRPDRARGERQVDRVRADEQAGRGAPAELRLAPRPATSRRSCKVAELKAN